jgi:hypothetical protein
MVEWIQFNPRSNYRRSRYRNDIGYIIRKKKHCPRLDCASLTLFSLDCYAGDGGGDILIVCYLCLWDLFSSVVLRMTADCCPTNPSNHPRDLHSHFACIPSLLLLSSLLFTQLFWWTSGGFHTYLRSKLFRLLLFQPAQLQAGKIKLSYTPNQRTRFNLNMDPEHDKLILHLLHITDKYTLHTPGTEILVDKLSKAQLDYWALVWSWSVKWMCENIFNFRE